MDEPWMKFMATGKVNDYLRYKDAQSEKIGQAVIREPEEERPDGTEYRNDRNGLTGYANWRI